MATAACVSLEESRVAVTADELKRAELSRLRTLRAQVCAEVEAFVRRGGGQTFPDPYSDVDQTRLVTLALWAEKYKVPVRFIIEHLVPIVQSMMRGKLRRSMYLGISPATFCGNFAEKKLQEEITRAFPDAENEWEWRWNKQREQLPESSLRTTVKSIIDYDSIDLFVAAYGRRIKRKRSEVMRAKQSSARSKQPYRGNPWR